MRSSPGLELPLHVMRAWWNSSYWNGSSSHRKGESESGGVLRRTGRSGEQEGGVMLAIVSSASASLTVAESPDGASLRLRNLLIIFQIDGVGVLKSSELQ